MQRRCRCPLQPGFALLPGFPLFPAQPQLAVVAGGGVLEELDDLAQVEGDGGFHEEDAMQVVGHDLQGDDGDLRVVVVDGVPLPAHGVTER